MTLSINNVKVIDSLGSHKNLGEYKGKVLLIVNVASQCGFTKQYEGLQTLQNTYKKQGLLILGFPCNDFGNQEPGSLEEIKAFCSLTYKVDFELFAKVHAKGNTTEPYTTLNKTNPAGDVAWNFEKFLIDRDCKVVGRFKSDVEPLSEQLINEIEKALGT